MIRLGVMDAWDRRWRASQRRQELRQRAVEYKGGKCEICGYDRCLNALEFHHTETYLKDFNISSRMTSWEAIVEELKKCTLLCANHHREVHDGLHPHYISDADFNGGDCNALEESELV